MSLSDHELRRLKIEFEAKWPEAVKDLTRDNSLFRKVAECLWLGYKEGYILGKTTKGNLT